ncbi:MAG: trigger factor [Lachnospiraceae bacterium]|nr:trigger factor [Lachnospiraceae bacterium]
MKKLNKFIVLAIVLCLVSACGTEEDASGAGGYDPLEYIELGEYKGLKVERLSTEVTDKDVENLLESLLSSEARYEEITDHDDVREGDIANIDFVGKRDGVAFDGGTGKGYDLKIGSGTFIPGFEESMIGMKVGETKDLDLTFPEDYGAAELAGQDVVFEVTVNSLKKPAETKITDEAVKEYTNGEYESIADYKVKLKEDLTSERLQYADSAMYTDLWEQAVKNATVKGSLPEKLVDEKKELMKNNALAYAESYNMTMDEFLSGSMGITEAEFEEQTADYALKAAKESLVLHAIADAEGLNITDEELNEGIDEYVAMYNYPSREEFINSTDLNEFREYILESKVQEFLADNAVISVKERDSK